MGGGIVIGNAIEQAQHTDNGRLLGALVLKAGYDANTLTQGKDVTSVDATGTTEAATQAAKAAQIAQGQEMVGSHGGGQAAGRSCGRLGVVPTDQRQVWRSGA